MKKEYVTPIMVGEEFSANEYVAAVYTKQTKLNET